MPCESYKNALSEAAARAALGSTPGSTISSALRSHLDFCADCRAFLDQEQALYASIDEGLRIVANTEVPPSLIPSVRARLSEQPYRRRWILAPATVAVAASLLIALVLARVGNRTPKPTTTSVQSAVNAPSHEAVTGTRDRDNATPSVAKSAATRHGLQRRSTQPAEPVVLIPPGQEKVVALLIAGLRRGEIDGEVLMAERSVSPVDDLQIPALSVAPLELKPLNDLQGRQE
jgi:hypothetical protein